MLITLNFIIHKTTKKLLNISKSNDAETIDKLDATSSSVKRFQSSKTGQVGVETINLLLIKSISFKLSLVLQDQRGSTHSGANKSSDCECSETRQI